MSAYKTISAISLLVAACAFLYSYRSMESKPERILCFVLTLIQLMGASAIWYG